MDNEENLLFSIRKGADIQAKPAGGLTQLHYATGFNRARNIQILLNYGAHIVERSRYGATALHFATFYGAERTVRTLVENGGDLEIKADDGLEKRHEGVVRILLSAGARFNVGGCVSLKSVRAMIPKA